MSVSFGLIILALCRLFLGTVSSPQGLVGSYYANPYWHGPPESTWVYRSLGRNGTRLDQTLDFPNDGFCFFRDTFPTFFANDSSRFNWYGNREKIKRRENFPFSAEWKGVLRILKSDPHSGVLLGSDYASIEIDGVSATQSENGQVSEFSLEPGDHRVVLRYAYGSTKPRRMLLGWRTPKNLLAPIPSSRLSPNGDFSNNTSILMILNFILLLGWIVLLLVIFTRLAQYAFKKSAFREHVVLFSIAMALIIAFSIYLASKGAKPYAEYLSGGDDWLTYETMARNILQGDFLDISDTGGKPFYYNPLYRYLLALMHLIIGESTVMVKFLQFTLMILIIYLLYWTGRHLYERKVGVFAGLLAILCHQLLEFPKYLLDSTFSIGCSLYLIYFLIKFNRNHKPVPCMLSGILLGIACCLRANFFAFVPVAAGFIIWSAPPYWSRKLRFTLLFFIFFMLPMLAIGARNYHVAGSCRFLPTSGPINVWIGNHPPDRLVPFPNDPFGETVKYMKSNPKDFLTGLGKKALFIAGIQIRENDIKIAYGVLIPFLICLAAIPYLLRNGPAVGDHKETWLMIAWITVNSFILLLIFPWGYGWRLLGPTFPVIYLVIGLYLAQTGFPRSIVGKTMNYTHSKTN